MLVKDIKPTTLSQPTFGPPLAWSSQFCLCQSDKCFLTKTCSTRFTLIKLCQCKFTHTLLKARRFHCTNAILFTLTKWSSLQKRVSKFTPHWHCKIDSRCFSSKTIFLGIKNFLRSS